MVVRAALRFGFGTASLLAGGWVLRALQGAPAALGASPAEIESVARRSPNFSDGVFVNIDPASGISLDREEQRQIIWDLIGSRGRGPRGRIPVAVPAPADPAATRLSACWFGHSSALIEIDGYRVLADPVWSRRCSPSQTVGPERMHEVPVPLEGLAAMDAVLISHDHYDHLDIDTIIGLARTQRAPFVVPLGVGAHLRKWGIPEARIVELDWHESHRIGELTLVCTPARHFSGRLFSRNTTLWASWVIVGPKHRAAAADRRLPSGVAGHSHESGRGGAGPPRCGRGGFRIARAHSLGDVPARAASMVGAGRTAGRRRRLGGCPRGGAQAGPACRSRDAMDVRPLVAVVSGRG
jgi:hypothetical protein